MRRQPARRHRGFSLGEILAALVIVAVVAAAVIPTVYGSLRDSGTRRKATTLSTLAQAIMTYHDHVGMWPSSLVQLTTKPTAGTDVNICSGAMAAKDVARWYGPYVGTAITSGGLVLEDDTVRVALVYQSTTNLQIKMEYPVSDTRTQVQNLLDSDTDSLTGVIRWSGTDPTKTLTYNLPIVGC